MSQSDLPPLSSPAPAPPSATAPAPDAPGADQPANANAHAPATAASASAAAPDPNAGINPLLVARSKRQVSMRKLAELSGISAMTINFLENEYRCAHFGTLFALATALNIPVADLLPLLDTTAPQRGQKGGQARARAHARRMLLQSQAQQAQPAEPADVDAATEAVTASPSPAQSLLPSPLPLPSVLPAALARAKKPKTKPQVRARASFWLIDNSPEAETLDFTSREAAERVASKLTSKTKIYEAADREGAWEQHRKFLIEWAMGRVHW